MDRKITGANATTALFVLLAVTIFAAWMSVGAYQSHYISALRTLGDSATNSLIGEPKDGRGDEWSTYLPMLKQAYNEGFPKFSKLAPYRERLDWFIAIPHANLSLLFLPNQATYWILPGAKALSFQGFYYNALFIGSCAWFLFNLGVKPRLAFAAAFAILFSQLYQLWWTSNFPTLGASLLPFAVFSSRLRAGWKYPLLFWSLAHMLFGEMYPPFYISLAAALLPFTLAARPELITARQLALAALAAVAALGVYLLLNWDFVELVSGTSYPGHRVNLGGDSNIRAIINLVFPSFPLAGAHVSGHTSADALYDLGMAATFFPLLLLAALPYVKWDKATIRVTIVSVVVASTLIYYMVFGFSEALAKLSGFYLVPGRRMALGLSVLLSFYAVFVLSRNWERLRTWPFLLVAVGYAGVSYLVGTDAKLETNLFGIQFYGYLPLALVLVAGLLAAIPTCRRRFTSTLATCVVAGMTLAHLVIFGSFNPVMRAGDILRPVDSQVTRDWKALYKKNGDRPLAVVGNYGHVLRGEGLAALEAIHLANVDPRIYAAIFPQLSLAKINELFNQFRGIAFANIPKMDSSGATVIFPIKPYAVAFPHRVARDDGNAASLSSGSVSAVGAEQAAGSFVVRWESSLMQPLAIDAPLAVWFPCPVKTSWLTRYPVIIPSEPLVDSALQGLAGEVTVSAKTMGDAISCVSKVRITSSAATSLQQSGANAERSAPALVAAGAGAADARVESGFAEPVVEKDIRVLKQNPFPVTRSTDVSCSFDSVDGNYSRDHVKVKRGVTHEFRGWVLNQKRAPRGRFIFFLKGKKYIEIPAQTGISRPDVAAYYHDPATVGSGFTFTSTLQSVPAGEYDVSLLIEQDGVAHVCDAGKSLTIQ